MMKYLKKYPFEVFLVLHFALWSLVPLLRKSLPMDSIEAVSWGMYCDFGTNKHPPLSGWLADFFYNTIGFETPFFIYALSQICVVLGFIYVFRLAHLFVSKEKAVLAAMLLEGVIYYGFSSLEYNVNVVSLALWPMTVYYFYKAVKSNKTLDWALTGAFAGLNLLNKYTSGVLLICMALYMLFDAKARSRLKTLKPCVAFLVCLAVFAPHFIWLYKHDFFVMSYFMGRGSQGSFENMLFLKHIVYPLKFIGAQILFSAGTFLIYFIATRGERKTSAVHSKDEANFLIYMGVLPVFFMFCISLVFGLKLKSMWGFPSLYLLGLILTVFFPYQTTERLKKKLTAGVYVLMFVFALAQLLVISLNKSDKFQLEVKKYGQTVEALWAQNSDKPFEYVAGDVWWANNAALFAPSKPKPVIWGDVRQNPWFDAKDIEDKGALVLSSDEATYFQMQQKLGFEGKPQILRIKVQNRFKKTKEKTIYYGFYNN